jgi:hypothetical protein
MSEALFGSRFFVFLITLYADVNERVPRHFVNQFFPLRAFACQMVDPAGLEPATPALSRRCSNQLSYGSIL